MLHYWTGNSGSQLVQRRGSKQTLEGIYNLLAARFAQVRLDQDCPCARRPPRYCYLQRDPKAIADCVVYPAMAP